MRVFLMMILAAVLVCPLTAGETNRPDVSLVLPAPDESLQSGLTALLNRAPFRDLVRRKQLSVVLVDLSDPNQMRLAAHDPDVMRYAASLPKIAVLLAVFDQIDRGHLEYTPELKQALVRMIRSSSNRAASDMIELVSFETIERVLRDPQYELYDPDRQGGLWVGKDYGGPLGRYKRDPIHSISHGATSRQVARFLIMMQQGRLITPWASQEMKEILSEPAITHKFVRGLESRQGSRIYRKSGTWKEFHSDAALVERDGKSYVAVALSRHKSKGVLAKLIVGLDDLVFAPNSATVVATAHPD